MNSSSNTFMLSSQVYLEPCTNDYVNIVVCNTMPAGPLAKRVIRMQPPYISPFQNGSGDGSYTPGTGGYRSGRGHCILALSSIHRKHPLMYDNEIPDLFGWLMGNGYTIDTALTNMMNKGEIRFADTVICFVTFKG